MEFPVSAFVTQDIVLLLEFLERQGLHSRSDPHVKDVRLYGQANVDGVVPDALMLKYGNGTEKMINVPQNHGTPFIRFRR